MSETLYEDIRLNVSWDDPTITGQQFIDRTRGFLALLAKNLPELPHRELYLPQERHIVGLEPDFSNFDVLITAAQTEGEETVRLHRHAYTQYIAWLSFSAGGGKKAFKLLCELSVQRGANFVSFEFAPDYQQEDLVFFLFTLALEYWRPTMGSCGSYSILKEINSVARPLNKLPIKAMFFRTDPNFTKDLPDFVAVTPVANGYVLQVLDDAPFADSPQGRDKVGQLFQILAERGLLDDPPPPKIPTPPPPTPEELSAMGIGGASAPIKPRRFPKST